MIKLVFATNNIYKIKEVSNLVNARFKILSLKDINCFNDIPENSDTLEGNASDKAFYVYNKYGLDCFADDTGLEIEALKGEPGIYSARYAGENKDFDDNMNKVLRKLKGITNRKARFRTVISLVVKGKAVFFEGVVNGVILNKKRGDNGFGYDPVFKPNGYNKSFSEMSLEEKNKISHRFFAVQKFINYLT
jgi:XTP/dITP diphosphohydrolase